MNSVVNSNEKFKLELMWKKGGFEVGGEHRFVKFHNGNIFHISYENEIKNSVEMFDLNGNLKWRYVREKGNIVGWSFLENILFICWNSRDSLGNCLDSGIIALDYNGKIKYECNARDIDEKLWIMSMFSDGKYVAVWDSGLVCLLDIYEDGLKLRWKYSSAEEPGLIEIQDVKICSKKVIVVSEYCTYWFDIDGNMKNKIEDGYDHCEIIKNVVICSGPCIPITAYYLDNGNLAWEFDSSKADEGIGYETIFLTHGFKHKHNDYFIIFGYSYILDSIRDEDNEVESIYIFTPEGEVVNRIFIEDKFKEKIPNPYVQKTIWCLSTYDNYLGVGTFDGYFFLFALKGELLSVWHTPLMKKEIEEKEFDKITSSLQPNFEDQSSDGSIIQLSSGKVIQVDRNGIVRNIYEGYYRIESLDLENNYVLISYNNEFVLLKIIKI